MSEIWVVNASPIVTLAKAGHLDLLKDLPDDVLVPEAVVAEVLAGPESDPARRAMENGWGTRVAVASVPDVVLEWSLGAGESAVLALALERSGHTAVLDDRNGRMCARALHIPLLGTLGVVLRAKRLGRINSASDVVRALRASGLHLDDATIRTALKRGVGEDWIP